MGERDRTGPAGGAAGCRVRGWEEQAGNGVQGWNDRGVAGQHGGVLAGLHVGRACAGPACAMSGSRQRPESGTFRNNKFSH